MDGEEIILSVRGDREEAQNISHDETKLSKVDATPTEIADGVAEGDIVSKFIGLNGAGLVDCS